MITVVGSAGKPGICPPLEFWKKISKLRNEGNISNI
jgi:hypothetical protein